MGLIKWIALGVIAVVAVTIVLWFLGLEPGVSIWNPIMYMITHIDLSGISTTNWMGFGGIFGVVSGFIGTAYKWLKTRSELFSTKKKAAENMINNNAQINELTNIAKEKETALSAVALEKEALQAKVTQYETKFNTSKETIMKQEMDIERLRSQIDGLSKQNVDKLADDISMQIAEKNRVA